MIEALSQTIKITAMVMMIVVGGVLFASVFIIHGGDDLVSDLITGNEFSQTQIILLFLIVVFILGFILDWISVLIIVLPISDPIVRTAEIDPVWFGVMV